MIAEFIEPCGLTTCKLYDRQHLEVTHKLVGLNYGTPTFVLGESSGMFALESAMDELAYVLNIDPVTLRLTNHTDIDPDTGNGQVSTSKNVIAKQPSSWLAQTQRNTALNEEEIFWLVGDGYCHVPW